MSVPPLLAAEELCRLYGPLKAVDGVSFELRRGEVVGLLGANGAGKSSTLQMICGVLPPSRGRVRIDGIDMQRQPRLAKARVGYLPAQPPLHPSQSVNAYLGYCGRLRGLRGSALDSACRRAARACGLSEVGQRLLGHLSKGYQQRVGIAQAIVHEPALVVLDEPMLALDPVQTGHIRTLVGRLREQHGVIFSSHVLGEVQALCDRVILLAGGRVVLDRSLRELAAEPARHYRLGLAGAPAPAVLEALPGVRAARMAAAGELRLEVDPEAFDPAGFLRHAVLQGWAPGEFTPERSTLEQVFLRHVLGGAGPVPAAQSGPSP